MQDNIRLINLTPHDITIIHGDGITTVLPKCTSPVRCTQSQVQIGIINNIPVFQKTFGDVINMPDPMPNTMFIVSAIVAQALKDKRNDVLIVNDTIRNSDGVIIGCNSFAIV